MVQINFKMKINLKEVIEKTKLDKKEVAQHLFPRHKYPALALNRVLSGDGILDADQISKLALFANTPISDLYSGEEWKGKSKEGIHTFTNGSFRAELNTETWVTKIFHKESLFHDSIIHSGSVPLSEYLKELDNQILKFKENESN